MKRWGALITLSLAMFIIVIDTTIMNVSISALIGDLDTTVSGIQAAISIYALVMAALVSSPPSTVGAACAFWRRNWSDRLANSESDPFLP